MASTFFANVQSAHRSKSSSGALLKLTSRGKIAMSARTAKKIPAKAKIPPLKKGVFSQFIDAGKRLYSLKSPDRHKALLYAAAKYTALATFRRLVALRTLNKNKNPKLSQLIDSDVKWLKRTLMNTVKR